MGDKWGIRRENVNFEDEQTELEQPPHGGG
jgi:hypothetical protein